MSKIESIVAGIAGPVDKRSNLYYCISTLAAQGNERAQETLAAIEHEKGEKTKERQRQYRRQPPRDVPSLVEVDGIPHHKIVRRDAKFYVDLPVQVSKGVVNERMIEMPVFREEVKGGLWYAEKGAKGHEAREDAVKEALVKLCQTEKVKSGTWFEMKWPGHEVRYHLSGRKVSMFVETEKAQAHQFVGQAS